MGHLGVLTDMGFSLAHATRALTETNNASIKSALDWYDPHDEHMRPRLMMLLRRLTTHEDTTASEISNTAVSA